MDTLHHVSARAPAAPIGIVASQLEIRAIEGGRGVFATLALPAGARLLDEEDWNEDATRKGFSSLTPQQLGELSPQLRALFVRFAFNAAPGLIRGSFHPETVTGTINFINHSCEPNAGYDRGGNIVALTRIKAGEEIHMDYGTFSFSFDHEFTCRCGGVWCRSRVTQRDWPELVRAGLRLPRFMCEQANKALWG
jgi:hypothetical protein